MPTAVKESKDASGRDVVEKTTELSERLIKAQYDLTNVVHSAGEALGASGKKE